MLKDGGHSCVTLGIFLPDAVKPLFLSACKAPVPTHHHVTLHTPPPRLKDF